MSGPDDNVSVVIRSTHTQEPKTEMLIRVALPQSREPEFQTMTGSIEAQNGKGGYSCDGSCHGLAHGSASGISLMPRDESLVYHLPPELTKTA